jgi:hypothetical protein
MYTVPFFWVSFCSMPWHQRRLRKWVHNKQSHGGAMTYTKTTSWGCIFSHVRPFHERAVSDLGRYMHRSPWVMIPHSSFIEGSHTTKNTASACSAASLWHNHKAGKISLAPWPVLVILRLGSKVHKALGKLLSLREVWKVKFSIETILTGQVFTKLLANFLQS